jgi:alcohol dehydrogenase (cytochrome c)
MMWSLACLAAAVLLVSGTGCQKLQFLPFLKSPVDPGPQGWSRTVRGPALAAAAPRGTIDTLADWAAYNRDPTTSQRYSPLAQITSANVGALHPVCVAHLGEQAAMQSGPVVVGGTLYVTSAINTWAIDAATCRLRWKHSYQYDPRPDYDLKVNRGVAFVDTPDGVRLVRGANDGRVYALDAHSGDEVWNVRTGDVRRGETFPAAPVAWRDVVYIGNAGGDNYGVTGRMLALDARTGATLWRAELVPRTGPANLTWPAETDSVPRAGATTWTSYTLDTLRALLYVPTGNAAPDFIEAVRSGTNDHSYSIVAIDARTGEIRRAYKLLESDVHDWDVAAAPLLVRSGAKRSLVIVAGKDGLVYGLQRESGAILYRTPITRRENVDAPLTPQGTRFCPGVQGGVEWNGPAYSPRTNAVYVGAVDWCSTVQVDPPEKLEGKRGLPWTGSARLTQPFGRMDPKAEARGWITAVDADDGSVRWRHRTTTPIVAGITATAGDVVFAADLAGHVFGFDAATGAERFRYDTGQPIGGGIVTYLVAGRQYVAVASGLHAPLSWQTESSPATIVVLALP